MSYCILKGDRSVVSFLLIVFLMVMPVSVLAQENSMQYFFTTADFRTKFYDALVKFSIDRNLASDLHTVDGQYDFRSAFWPMELIKYKSEFVKKRLEYAFDNVGHLDRSFKRSLLEAVYTNWPDSFDRQVEKLLQETRHPKIFALCAEYLWRGGQKAGYKKEIIHVLKRRFIKKRNDPTLLMLSERLSPGKPENFPPIADLLGEQFAPGLTVLYSFQRPDRRYPGRAIVRKPDGSFVQDSTGQLFSVAQLALSLSNLPFYLTNGNTPQGIYRMSGFDVSSSRFIGPTENIQMSMPFEIPADSFIISSSPTMDTKWDITKYRLLLPKSWKDFRPVFESFYAGKAGRTAIIAHGTTVDPQYYKGESYFPETPTLGCLCTFEEWSGTGYRQRSDQQSLVHAVKMAGNGVGYVVVVDLQDKSAPVTTQEVWQLVNRVKNDG